MVHDSVIMCDEIIKETKTIPTKSTSTKTVLSKCARKFYILLAFLSITIVLLIAVSIYCYLIKYQPKQRPLLPCHYTTSKLKETGIRNKMKNNDKLKEISIKNCTCSYFDDIIRLQDFDLDNCHTSSRLYSPIHFRNKR